MSNLSSNNIHFQVQFAHTRQEIEDSTIDLGLYDRDKAAYQLGEMIVRKKGIEKMESGNMLGGRISVYVFTANELMQFKKEVKDGMR